MRGIYDIMLYNVIVFQMPSFGPRLNFHRAAFGSGLRLFGKRGERAVGQAFLTFENRADIIENEPRVCAEVAVFKPLLLQCAR